MIDKKDGNSEQKERNWKLYEASTKRIDMLNQRQADEDDKIAKWLMTFAAGSFGLSFAFIDKIVPIEHAHNIPLLIVAWSCFISVLVLGLIASLISSFIHSVMADEEAKNLPFKYEGIEPEYKKRSIFFGTVAVFGYISILSFIGGSICLILFISENLL